MSSLRGRTRDSSWQWLIIGLVLGLGCSGVFCLAGYATNYIAFHLPGQPNPDQLAAGPTIVIVTTTPAPATPTSVEITQQPPLTTVAATQTLAGPSTESALGPLVVVPSPSGTFVGTPISSPVPPTIPPTKSLGAELPTPTVFDAALATSAQGPSIPDTELITVAGGIFEMGTTTKEAQQAVDGRRLVPAAQRHRQHLPHGKIRGQLRPICSLPELSRPQEPSQPVWRQSMRCRSRQGASGQLHRL